MQTRNFTIRSLLYSAIAVVLISCPANAKTELISDEAIQDVKKFINTEIVRQSLFNQNEKYNNLAQADIDDLDKQWRNETKAEEKPLISAVLSNPLSSYLTRIQAHSIGLYTEMFVMDKNGLNVGQSNISSDYWQGDEAKFQKTYLKGKDSVFIDEPEFDEDMGIWKAQVNMAITDETNKHLLGAVTVEFNLTELQRRRQNTN